MRASDDILRFSPAGPLRGRIRVPSDKSITHRALLLGSVCERPVRVERPLWAGDTQATAGVMRMLGVRIDPLKDANEAVLVHGRGLCGLLEPRTTLNVCNSGTTIRLLSGLLAGQRGRFVLDGDESLRRRPMDRVVAPLSRMGVMVTAREGRFPPLEVRGGPVRAITYESPIASAQVKSCVLLAGLHAEGETTVVERIPSRDHTERLLCAAGAALRRDGGRVSLRGRPRLQLDTVRVPGDPSSAAFLAAAAALVPGSELIVEDLGLNPTRLGFFEVLRRMGGSVEWIEETSPADAGEPRGRLLVRQAPLHGTVVSAAEIPQLIDEVPLVALLATVAEGETLVEGVGELRVKESDRLAAVGEALGRLGARIEVGEDAFRVFPGPLRGGRLESRGDHRLALLGAVAGLAAPEGVRVHGFSAADVSFPGFQHTLQEVFAS